MLPIMTFPDALAEARAATAAQAVLLGNGFSIAYDHMFLYEHLVEAADLAGLGVDAQTLFDHLGTADFELVIDRLRGAADLLELYQPRSTGLVGQLRADAIRVGDGLAEAIAAKHPDASSELPDDRRESAARFLANFAEIFTLNYDLLLYWVIVGSNVLQGSDLWHDGFRGDAESDSVIWDEDRAEGRDGLPQKVHYLHGALHLSAADTKRGPQLRKLRYQVGGRLVDQIRASIHDGSYPMLVTEGSTEDKLAKVRSSPYLNFCHRALRNVEGSLFAFGASLKANDTHILDALADPRSKVTRIYASFHGPESSRAAVELSGRLECLQADRHNAAGHPLTVQMFRAEDTGVWRP